MACQEQNVARLSSRASTRFFITTAVARDAEIGGRLRGGGGVILWRNL